MAFRQLRREERVTEAEVALVDRDDARACARPVAEYDRHPVAHLRVRTIGAMLAECDRVAVQCGK